MSKVCVIGGGASGLMAAYAAGMCGHDVTLLEKNEKLGKKIYITGKGRCNFTNACEPEDFLKNVVRNPKFLYSAIYTLTPDGVIDFFESFGIPTKVERGNRAFPESDHASDITRGLEKACKSVGVRVKLNCEVKGIEDCGEGQPKRVVTSSGTLDFDSLIIATGGLSYRTTGSTGDGLEWAKALGVKVTPTRPSLVPFNVKEEYIKSMQGLSLKNVTLTIKDGDKKVYEEFGEMLFTHFGVSGPLVLSASAVCPVKPLNAFIDLKPALSVEELDARILRDVDAAKNKQLKSIVSGLLPSKMVEVFLEVFELDGDLPVNSLTKEMRKKIVGGLKAFPFAISGLRDYNEAVVTCGGVDVKEIDSSTMEVKKHPGIYFTGEVLDVDAYTGGFNLQIAFSTGYLAGISIK